MSFSYLKKNQLSPVSAANMFIDVGPFTGAQATYEKSQPWEKMLFHICSHLSIIHSRGVGPCMGPSMPPLPSMLKFWWSLSCTGDKCCVLMIVMSCPEDTDLQQSSPRSEAYKLHTMFSAIFPQSWRRETWYRCLFRQEYSTITYSLYLDHLWVCINHIHGKKILWLTEIVS